MSAPYLAVAIDHRSSFDQYLAVAGSVMTRDVAKQRLAQLVGGAVDALVIESRHRPSWAMDWPGHIWWGAPDLLVQAETPRGKAAAELALHDVDSAWFTGVKLGVNATGVDAWTRACSEMEGIADITAAANLTIVFEPYFTETDDLSLREDVLEYVTGIPQVEYAKLDVYNNTLLSAYTKASRVPWLARSDGRSYGEYARSLREAVTDGCGGCMIGAALWSDTLADVDENAQLLLDRLAELRSILALQVGGEALHEID